MMIPGVFKKEKLSQHQPQQAEGHSGTLQNPSEPTGTGGQKALPAGELRHGTGFIALDPLKLRLLGKKQAVS